MSYDIGLLSGTVINQYCNLNFLSNNLISYGILLIFFIGILYQGNKKNYTIYTLLPIATFSVAMISLFIYSLDCTYAPAIHGKFVVVCFFLIAITLLMRKMLEY